MTDVVPGLVSVVVASYNHARFLERRMDSLIRQTYRALEVIVIDDRSTDNSVEVLQRYTTDPRVRLVVRDQNGGWVAVSNQGVELARGEFLMFANCDDSCDPKLIECLVAAMRANPTAGIAYCRSWLTDENDAILADDFIIRERAFRRRCETDTLIDGRTMAAFLMESCVIPNLSAALFRRDVYLAAGMLSPSYRVVCDWNLFFRVVECADAFYIAEPLNNFRQHGTTIRSSTKHRAIYDEYFHLLLGELHLHEFSFYQRARFRVHIMTEWAGHLIAPSTAGIRNFAHHLGGVARRDPTTLLFLLPGILARTGHLVGKMISGRRSPVRT